MKYQCKCGEIVGGTGRTRHLINGHGIKVVELSDLKRYFKIKER